MIKCPECESSNVEIERMRMGFPLKKKEKTLLGRVADFFQAELASPVYPSGQYVIKCKDCGKQGVLFVN